MEDNVRRDLLTPSQAAQVLGVSSRTVIRWADNGQLDLETRTLGGHRRFRRSVVEGFRDRLAEKGRPVPPVDNAPAW